ncbi:hypothetical protein XFF6992_200087 [Xanthomonas citri pv. fuscans]|nr:hypothetical protein XFF6992_200087 [Xanthomonas citri pv. fuscans]SOO31060.1 hypothetical protein XFF6994_1210007 [Xanthomonas citri pv. fuscans]
MSCPGDVGLAARRAGTAARSKPGRAQARSYGLAFPWGRVRRRLGALGSTDAIGQPAPCRG